MNASSVGSVDSARTVFVVGIVDWVRLFGELRARGLSSYEINRRTGQSRSALRDYAAGLSEPSHHVGEIILAFWVSETGKTRDTIPYRQADI